MSKVQTWFPLLRPWSLTATFVPLAVAAALSWREPSFTWWRWALALAAAAPLQIVVNLLNTWGDDASGVDSAPGAICTTPQIQNGLVTPRQVLAAAAAFFALSASLAAPLFFPRGFDFASFNWPLAAVAAAGAFGALNYSTGVKFKYRGLGVPFVFFLMGTIEILGGVFASAPGAKVDFARVLATSLPVNALVAVIMHGNDMRDISGDLAAGIRTTANVIGPRLSLALYWLLHLTPYAVSLFCFVLQLKHSNTRTLEHFFFLLPFLALPLTLRTLLTATRTYREKPSAPPWIRLERASAGAHLVVGLLWSVALFFAAR